MDEETNNETEDNEVPTKLFCGNWFPPILYDLIEDGFITATEAVLAIMITAYTSNKKDCFASNEFFAKRLNCQTRQISRYIKNLKALDIIQQTKFNGRKRFIKSNIGIERPDRNSLSDRKNLSKRISQNSRTIDIKIIENPRTAGADASRDDKSNGKSDKKSSRRFQTTFTRLWEKKYPDEKYPFNKATGGMIKNAHKQLKGDRGKWKKIVKRYLANSESFYHGHPINKLIGALPQFMFDAKELTYSDENSQNENATERTFTARTGKLTKADGTVIEYGPNGEVIKTTKPKTKNKK